LTSDSFFVGFKKNLKGQIVGHFVSPTPDIPIHSADDRDSLDKASQNKNPKPGEFRSIFHSYKNLMQTYTNFVPLTLYINTEFSNSIAGSSFIKYCAQHGRIHENNDELNVTIYKLEKSHYRNFQIELDSATSALAGSRHLPEVMLIGLVSVYESHIYKSLRHAFLLHPRIILKDDKSIKYSDLMTFSSIESATHFLIDREIDDVLRNNKRKQIDYFNNTLKMDISVIDEKMNFFLEVIARRNLFTHTGGVVSEQYLEALKNNPIFDKTLSIGSRATVSPEYFRQAVSVFYEIGLQILYGFWVHFHKNEVDDAASTINETCFDLIFHRQYQLAQSLLEKTLNSHPSKHRPQDSTKRTMLVNLANTYRLLGNTQRATELIDAEDWSSCDNKFLVCCAAVKGDIDTVCKLLPALAKSEDLTAENFRNWPVFRGLETNQKFIETFETAFGTRYIAKNLAETTEPSAPLN
jgi:hypothetical protein